MNSSDLALATALSRRLGRPFEAGTREPEPAHGYAKFEVAPPPAAARRSSSVPAVEAARVAQASPLEMESWEVFLAWAMELSRARAAFVVDSQGFVIASRGNIPGGDFSGTGAELCFAMEQLAGVDSSSGTLRFVELQFEGYKLIGLSFPGETPERNFIIGFVGSRSVSDDLRTLIFRQLGFSVPRF